MNLTQTARDLFKQATAIFPVGNRPWNTRPLAALMVGASLLVSGQTMAHNTPHIPDGYSHNTAHLFEASPHPNLPFVDLGIIDSQPGEAKDDYMMRVATVLDQFTTASGHEGCGVIMENATQDAWRVRLITNRSQIACVRMLFDEPGFQLTIETIHSHPSAGNRGVLYANAQDAKLRQFQCGRGMIVNDADFSEGDLENGAGYLVARGKLLYQNEDVHTTIGVIPTSDIVAGLVSIPNLTGRMSAPNNSQERMLTARMSASQLAWSKKDQEGLPGVSCKSMRSGQSKK